MASPLIVSLKREKSFCGSKIKILSPAKINLYLNIKGKYPGGFHRLESIVERISLCDEISITVSKIPKIKIFSNNKSLNTDENIIFKAANLVQRKYKIPFGFDIFLKKNIPIGAGLGGGSSNAASTLLGLNKLLNLKLGKKELYFLGAKLGSDVNFFLSQNKFAFLEGRGEKITPLRIRNKFQHFILSSGIPISTKKIYTGLRVKLTKFFNNANILRYALKKGDAFLIKKSIFNALERRVLSLYEELKKTKALLESEGIFVKVTGSGSAFYTIFSSISLSKIKSLLPKEWAVFEVITF